MEITERAQELVSKVRTQKSGIETEEATKNAFVMPFISTVLGYDVFNPAEVVPEFTADVGTKRGEKIDYALVNDSKVQILIEVKKVSEPLDANHASQLFRYFSVTNARIAILTNGEVYEFFTDLDKPNCMDNKPFLVLNFSALDETLLPELAELTKESFDLDSVLSAAGELKYIGQLKRILAAEFREPSEKWIRFLATQVYERAFTQKVRDQFAPLVVKAMKQFLNDQASDRLKKSLIDTEDGNEDSSEFEGAGAGAETSKDTLLPGGQPAPSADVQTTDEELEGYRIVRAIACSEVSAARVVARDTKTYFGVLLDDNNRKPIARLWFNRSKKYLGLLDASKVETRMSIECVEDIYQYSDVLRATVRRYLDKPESVVTSKVITLNNSEVGTVP